MNYCCPVIFYRFRLISSNLPFAVANLIIDTTNSITVIGIVIDEVLFQLYCTEVCTLKLICLFNNNVLRVAFLTTMSRPTQLVASDTVLFFRLYGHCFAHDQRF